MAKSIGYVVVCVLGLVACSVEHYDDCDDDFYDHDDGGLPSKPSAGAPSKTPTAGSNSGGSAGAGASGASGGTSGAAASGGTSGAAASGGTSEGGAGDAPNLRCDEERDCERGYNCDLDTHECVATDAETCPELETEAACSNRRDCVPVYGGINCSCGKDCECKGGEPGCICESFEFFACQSLSP
jgi:hypothetical protein